MKTIKRIKILIILSVGILFGVTFSAFADTAPSEHAIWDRTPISVILPVGQERMVTFPGLVQFGYDTHALPTTLLQVQNNNGTLYFIARQAFEPKRVQVRLIQNGNIILLNLSAQKGADNTPIQVELAQKEQKDHNEAVHRDDVSSSVEVNPITLMRFAENQLYAPDRLLITDPRIWVTPMHASKTVPLVLDGRILSTPLRSWRSGAYVVTAVTLHNMSADTISLSQLRLCGDWHMAAFFPLIILLPQGSLQDTTTAFVVSTEPFASAMGVCTGEGV